MEVGLKTKNKELALADLIGFISIGVKKNPADQPGTYIRILDYSSHFEL